MEEKKITLILVDFQKDFISESGSLYVRGSSSAVWQTLELLKSGKVERVIFTLDWHSINHCSFKQNGGEWPTHCVEYTMGALPDHLLYQYCLDNNIPTRFFHKGIFDGTEEYGAFKEGLLIGELFMCHDYWTEIDLAIDPSNVYIAGVAGDYCVLETIKNLEPIWDNLTVYLPGIASIDGGEKLTEFINENHLRTV